MENERGALLQFRILGPLEVVRDGESLAFRGTRERNLLALLVLNANRAVSAERLVEDLWSGDPPEGAIRALRVYVSRLRQALGAAGRAVVTQPSGYLLEVAPEAVDALRFEALVDRGRDQARGGDHDRAAKTLREALALWRGAALADVAEAPVAGAEANRLEEARLAALEDRVEADLACGRHGELTAELDALTGEHPFRERLWSQRIVALYRSGRQADALRAYRQLRLTLGEELGIEPSPALQRLEGGVLRHDPELDWYPGGIAAPPGSVAGLGDENRTAPSVATAEPARLPQALRAEERLPLVGREVELSRLDQTWQATCWGQRRLVLLAGEPGIGKSRLAAEFARTAYGAGALVLFGRCDEGMGVPYQPFVEALGRYLRQADDLVLGRLAGELVRLVPEVGERVHGLAPPVRSDPETERYRLFGAVAAWLGAMSESVPVVFVIEDLHWATKPTLLLLSHLLRSDEDLRLLVLVTFRDTPVDMTADLVDLVVELLRLPGVERVRLGGLTESGVGALMEAQGGHALDEAGWTVARMVHGETAGNPFYVREVLRHLAEQGDIVRRDGRWVAGQPLAELDVPDSVRDVVERRLTRLPDRTSEMLALAAVLGERFDLAVLAQASGEPENSVVQYVAAAVRARLVQETDAGRYHFTHALVRSTLEDALGPTRRLQLHRAAGLAVEAVHAGRLDPHLPQLAHHFSQARDVDKAIDYASRAGDRALAQLAHDEAAAYYRQALELLDPASRPDGEARRCELLISLGEAQRRAGDAAHRQTLLDAAHLARQLGDATALARAALANCRGFFSEAARVDTERISALESALAACPDPTATRARLLINLAAELGWSAGAPHRQALADEAVAIARGLDDPATLGMVLLPVRYVLAEPARPESNQEMAELALLAEQLDDPALAFWANLVQSLTALVFGDGAAHEHFLGRAGHAAVEIGQPLFRWLTGYVTVNQSRLAGRLALAEEQANQAMELGLAAGFPDARRVHGANMFGVRYDTGRLAEFAAFAGRRRGSDPLSTALFALAFGELGRPDEARGFIEDLRPDGFSALPGMFRLYYLTRFAEACACLGDADRAAVLYDLLAPHRGIMASALADTSGAVDHYLGLLAVTLGRPAAADHFADAARVHAAFPAPTLLARTRLEWARMLLTRGQSADAAHARDLLGQTLGTARDLGLGSIERQAVELLQECR